MLTARRVVSWECVYLQEFKIGFLNRKTDFSILDLKKSIYSKINKVMVHLTNRRIHNGQGIFGSVNAHGPIDLGFICLVKKHEIRCCIQESNPPYVFT